MNEKKSNRNALTDLFAGVLIGIGCACVFMAVVRVAMELMK